MVDLIDIDEPKLNVKGVAQATTPSSNQDTLLFDGIDLDNLPLLADIQEVPEKPVRKSAPKKDKGESVEEIMVKFKQQLQQDDKGYGVFKIGKGDERISAQEYITHREEELGRKLTKAEKKQIYTAMPKPMTYEEVMDWKRRQLDDMDRDNDNHVSKKEAAAFLEPTAPTNLPANQKTRLVELKS